MLSLLLLIGCEPGKTSPDWSTPPGTSSETGWSRGDTWGDTDTGPTSSDDTETGLSSPVDTWRGQREDEGFGAALAAGDDGAIYAGAPGVSGRVYRLEPGGSTPVILEETGAGALGVSLAWTAAGLIAGAPLQGEGGMLLDAEGTALQAGAAGAVLGGRVIAAGGGWAATTTDGALLDGEVLSTGARPGGLAWLGDALAVGLPRGESALWIDGALLPRAGARDEAGYALCAADLDGDGELDLAVGAPGEATVYLLLGERAGWSLASAVALRGEGRFGHALACSDGQLVVGAPLWGTSLAGAVWSFTGNPAGWTVGEPAAEGEAPGDQLGAAVLLTEEGIYAGAPGEADTPGLVRRL